MGDSAAAAEVEAQLMLAYVQVAQAVSVVVVVVEPMLGREETGALEEVPEVVVAHLGTARPDSVVELPPQMMVAGALRLAVQFLSGRVQR